MIERKSSYVVDIDVQRPNEQSSPPSNRRERRDRSNVGGLAPQTAGAVRLKQQDSGQRLTDNTLGTAHQSPSVTAEISQLATSLGSCRPQSRYAIICNFLCLIGVLRETIRQTNMTGKSTLGSERSRPSRQRASNYNR